MVMKVSTINSVFFKGNHTTDKDKKISASYKQIDGLAPAVRDFNVKIPSAYKFTGSESLTNGLTLYNYKLSNGYRVAIVPMENSPAVVKSYVNVGSMNEKANIKGISHFLEHMAFNGTNGSNGYLKLDAGDAFKKIDELGGWANASTNYALTDYVNSTYQLNDKDLDTQIKVIASMTEDLKLSDDMIKKEKGPVCSEINMILDDPQTTAMDQTVRTLFNIKNSADEMVGGSVASIKSLSRDDILNYYNTFYTPDNMCIVITGDVDPDKAIQLAAKNFVSKKRSSNRHYDEKLVPIQKTIRKDFINKKAVSADIILGFAGPNNNDARGRALLDIARAYLDSSFSRLKTDLKQYNTYPYIDSEKISTKPSAPRMVYIAASASDSNTENVLHTIFNTINSAQPISEETLSILKQKLLNEREEAFEYSTVVNDNVGKSILDGTQEYVTNYEKILDTISPKDVDKAIKEYFNLNKTAVTVIHPQKQNAVSFKGEAKVPLDKKQIEIFRLNNNYDTGIYKTKNNKINYNITLKLDEPYNKTPGAIEILDEIYSMGLKEMPENEFNLYKEKNNIKIAAYISSNGLQIAGEGRNLDKLFASVKALLYTPAITQENLDNAKKIIKDRIARKNDTAYRLYINDEAKNNSYEFTEDDILAGIERITLEDLKDCHNYILKNSRGIITVGAREDAISGILSKSKSLTPVKPNNIQEIKLYNPNSAAKVLIKKTNRSQADIMQTFKFKCDNSIKERAVGEIMNYMLTNSSIGLFNTLREKEHLAYSVYSSISKSGDRGELSCNILTTTDNKEIGEYSYENLQKSINGFNRQISALMDGKFTEQDLKDAKLAMKSNLLDNEGTSSKLNSIETGLNSVHGIDYLNDLYKEIDNITRDDIIKFTSKVFKQPPVYSIAASEDTLRFNKNYLEALES